jgi:hypothetical protein
MLVTAYYFRAHTYTLVPRHVREDMAWMADHGTDAISIGILEQDLFAAVENIQTICAEAQRAGLQVYATPSRWGSLVAGCPKVPSIFCARHPEAAVCDADGMPRIAWLGTVASVHHPATFDFFCESLRDTLRLFPISGIIWDEIKNLDLKDYSPAARQALAGRDLDDVNVHIGAAADFFDRVGAEAQRLQPDIRLCAFLYGHLYGYAVERCARIEHLHDFGCDGRPFRAEDEGRNDSGHTAATKLLLEQGPYFIEQAHRNGKRGLLLIENHAMADEDVPIMDRRLPEVFALGAEHMLYYYYPRSLEDPDRNMAVVGKHLLAAHDARPGGEG